MVSIFLFVLFFSFENSGKGLPFKKRPVIRMLEAIIEKKKDPN